MPEPRPPTWLYVAFSMMMWVSPLLAQQPPTWLYVSVTGRTAQAELESQIPRAIVLAAPALEGVLLFAPAWQEAQDIASSEVVRRILAACANQRPALEVVWGRHAWITHGDQQRDTDHVTAAYYASAMQRLAAEGAAMGAAATALDVEAYGPPMRDILLVTITRELHLRMAEAIELAALHAPRPTFVTPWGHRLQDHRNWVFSHLASDGLIQSSYRVRDSDHRYMDFTPPVGHSLSVTHPGFWLSPPEAQVGEGVPIPSPLTVQEFRDLDWAAWREKFPEMEKVWIYTDRHDLLEVCRQLGEGV